MTRVICTYSKFWKNRANTMVTSETAKFLASWHLQWLFILSYDIGVILINLSFFQLYFKRSFDICWITYFSTKSIMILFKIWNVFIICYPFAGIWIIIQILDFLRCLFTLCLSSWCNWSSSYYYYSSSSSFSSYSFTWDDHLTCPAPSGYWLWICN